MRVEKKGIKVIQGRLIDGTGSTPTKEAIVAANKNAAEYACNLGGKIGTIEAGKLADIIVVDGDPLEDVTILQDLEKIKMVMRNREIEVDRGL